MIMHYFFVLLVDENGNVEADQSSDDSKSKLPLHKQNPPSHKVCLINVAPMIEEEWVRCQLNNCIQFL